MILKVFPDVSGQVQDVKIIEVTLTSEECTAFIEASYKL